MVENRRKGEREGKKLTPGERAINWAKAIAVIVPLFGAGYVANTQTIKTLISEERPEAVDETPVRQNVEPTAQQPAQNVAPPEVRLSCPACPDIQLTCPDISLNNHEEEFHQ